MISQSCDARVLRPPRIGGYALLCLAQAREGAVHSVFRHGFNIEFEDCGNFLLYVQGFSQSLSCLGLQLESHALMDFMDVAMPGERVSLQGGVLSVGSVHVKLAEASEVSLRVRAAENLDFEHIARLRTSVDWDNVVAHCGLVLDVSDALAIEGLDEDGDNLDASVGYLLGRGIGLTPSGDDVLCGFGLARSVAGSGKRLRESLRTCLEQTQTTVVSRSYIEAMLAGYCNENYAELIRAVHKGSWGRVAALVRSISSVGHTSGYDSLLGFGRGLGVSFNLNSV